MSEELLPCPFCGGTAEPAYNDLQDDMSMARCVSCGAEAYGRKWQMRVNQLDGDVQRLTQALTDVANPIEYLRRHAEADGNRLNGMAYSIANDLHFVQKIARDAIGEPAALRSPDPGKGG